MEQANTLKANWTIRMARERYAYLCQSEAQALSHFFLLSTLIKRFFDFFKILNPKTILLIDWLLIDRESSSNNIQESAAQPRATKVLSAGWFRTIMVKTWDVLENDESTSFKKETGDRFEWKCGSILDCQRCTDRLLTVFKELNWIES